MAEPLAVPTQLQAQLAKCNSIRDSNYYKSREKTPEVSQTIQKDWWKRSVSVMSHVAQRWLKTFPNNPLILTLRFSDRKSRQPRQDFLLFLRFRSNSFCSEWLYMERRRPSCPTLVGSGILRCTAYRTLIRYIRLILWDHHLVLYNRYCGQQPLSFSSPLSTCRISAERSTSILSSGNRLSIIITST